MSLRDQILKIWRAGGIFGRISSNDIPQLSVGGDDIDSQTQGLDTSDDLPWADVMARWRASSEPSSDNQSFVTAPTITPTQYTYGYEESISLLSIALSNDDYLPEVDFGRLWSLSSQNALSLATVVAELAPIPSIGTLVDSLTFVFRAVEKSCVNKEQWKLLQGRCVMVTRIAGAQVTNYGKESYPDLQDATELLRKTLTRIGERANHWNKMHELVAFVQFPEISKEIKSHFVALDSCLNHFLASMSITGMVSCLVVTVQYATDVIQMQWVSEFNNIQKAEIEQLERMYTLIEGTIIELNITSQNQDDIATITTKTLELLRNAMDEKMEILHNQETTPVETYVGTQQIVQTIRAVTNIQLPIKFLVGKQCILDAIVPIKTGVTYDIYSASFLVNEKVAKKVFRGIWRKEQLEQYAQRFLREAKLRATFRSDYILPLYGIGADECKNNRHVQLYIVSPLMKNFDAVTYLRRHKENPNMKEGIMRIVTDAAKGLQYLHNQDPPVVHYGMRGDNILITDSGGGILCGFSLTKALPTGTENEDFPWVALNDQTHSPRWMAPEMFTKDAVVPHTPSDVWGWAMAALELISGLPPYYRSKSLHTIMPQILMSKRSLRSKYADFEKYALRPDKMWELLDRCWAVEPKDRPTIDEVLVDLEKMTRK